LDKVLDLEAEVVATLERPDLLRRNNVEMWESCLHTPHLCLGAWVGDELVAVAVLYVPQKGAEEDLSALLTKVDTEGCLSANFKICIVRPQWRGRHLQLLLGRRLHEVARRRGIGLLCATASPYNQASIRSLERLGYQKDHTLTKYGFERILFFCLN